jgi:hypothetical protein
VGGNSRQVLSGISLFKKNSSLTRVVTPCFRIGATLEIDLTFGVVNVFFAWYAILPFTPTF